MLVRKLQRIAACGASARAQLAHALARTPGVLVGGFWCECCRWTSRRVAVTHAYVGLVGRGVRASGKGA
jgi:hypothetical protein